VDEEKFLAELLKDIDNGNLVLPTLPEVALKVRETVDDPEVTAGKVADIIITDAALSARLLQVANSPLYRARTEIDSIQMAVTRLGTTLVRNLVTSLVMQQMFQATTDVIDTRLRNLWEHSTQVAAIARVLAAPFRHLQAEQAMLAGLIHDIGALPIYVRAEDMPELLDDEAALDNLVMKLHTRLGKVIMEHWQFPEALVNVAAEHENLEYVSKDGKPDFVDLVIVANLQSRIGTDHPLANVDFSKVSAFTRLGIDPEINIVDVEENKEQIAAIQSMLAGH